MDTKRRERITNMDEFPRLLSLPEGNDFTCANCGGTLGKIINVQQGGEAVQVMQLGGVIVHEMQGVCARCGMGVWQSVNAKRLQRLLEAVVRGPVDIKSILGGV